MSVLEKAREITRTLCLEFIEGPYLCYTEHGLHARYYAMRYNALSSDDRYTTWQQERICVVQKEHRTASPLGKTRRQNWDISAFKIPLQPVANDDEASYGYLRLAAAIELGMNESKEHLQDDIDRLSHEDAGVDLGIVVHLYRLSEPGRLFSGRDWSAGSSRILSVEDVAGMVRGTSVEVYCGSHDRTGRHENCVWLIHANGMERLDKSLSYRG